MDDFIAKFLDAPDTREAQAWLDEGSAEDFRSLSEHETMEESVALVQKLYGAGALKVLVVEIVEYDDGQNSGKLVIELPSDSHSRDAVLNITNEIAMELGFDADKDVGQSHVFVMLD